MPQQVTPDEHWLRGTPNRVGQRVKESDPPADQASRPKMPANLPPEGQAYWKYIVRLLRSRRTLTAADGPMLAVHCWTWLRWNRDIEKLYELGDTQTVTWTDQQGESHTKETERPLSKVVHKLEARLQAQLKDLGATPVAREKVKPAAKQPGPKREPTPEEVEAAAFNSLIERKR